MKIGVLFDMDGVLVASGPAHSASWRMTAKKHGINISDETFRATFGRTSREIIRMLWGEAISDAEVHRIDVEKEAMYRELITGMVPLMIGCREILGTMKASGFPLAVATSGPRENLELVLRETAIGGYFGATATGDEVPRGKPSPDIFLLAAKRLELNPSQCIVIEDAPVGIEAALTGGMRVIALVGTHPAAKLRDAGANLVVDHLSEITEALVRSLVKS